MAIGADGIKSVVREYVVSLSDTTGLGGQLIFTGSKAFRGLVTRERFERLFPNHRALVNAVMVSKPALHIYQYIYVPLCTPKTDSCDSTMENQKWVIQLIFLTSLSVTRKLFYSI